MFPFGKTVVEISLACPVVNVVSDTFSTKLDVISRPKLPVIAVIERFLTSCSSNISFTGIPAEFMKL